MFLTIEFLKRLMGKKSRIEAERYKGDFPFLRKLSLRRNRLSDECANSFPQLYSPSGWTWDSIKTWQYNALNKSVRSTNIQTDYCHEKYKEEKGWKIESYFYILKCQMMIPFFSPHDYIKKSKKSKHTFFYLSSKWPIYFISTRVIPKHVNILYLNAQIGLIVIPWLIKNSTP